MKQRFYHYTKWEDFQNGMYDEEKEGRKQRVQKAVELLSNTDELYKAMTKVVTEWKYASEQNLTNQSINHQAFLGQSACNIYYGIKEDETREAWGLLTNEQRYKANRVADTVYDEWKFKFERENEEYFQMNIFEMEE